MATTNMHNLTTLIKRLEAATSRLEDIASSASTYEGDATTNGAPKAPSTAGKGVPEAAAGVAAAGASPTPKSLPAKPALPPMIEDYDKNVLGDLKEYEKLSAGSTLGGLVSEQAKAVAATFDALRQFLLVTTKAKKPDMSSPAYMDTLKDLQRTMTAVDDIRQGNRASPFKDHLAMVADGAGSMAWVTIEPKPAEYIAELLGGAQMYGNKVLKQFKEKDEDQVKWVRSFYKLMQTLIAFVKQYHTKGVQWNPQGVDAAEAIRQVASEESSEKTAAPPAPPLPSASGPPPPPPPPPPGFASAPSVKKAPAADMGAVFADLQRGEAITSGLKKVDSSQMTHKNPTLRAGAVVPERSNSSSSLGRSTSPGVPPGKKPKPESLRTKKPPRLELDGNKWIVENHDSPSAPLEIQAEQNQSILITKCKGTTIRIHGKANAISIDNCPKTSLILDSLVSSVDVIKCPSFALQIINTVPTILLDQVDGASIYLSKDSLQTEVFTSKCSSINVNLPPEKEDDDYKEAPIPEQFRSWVKNGKLVTEIVEHAG